MAGFDLDATFGDDYLHFYASTLTDERSDADTTEIVATLDLQSGQRVLDAPCGHGRIANRLAQRGVAVVGIDRSTRFVELARHDADRTGVLVDYRVGDITALPPDLTGSFDAAINWFTSFGYHDDATNRAVLAEYHRVLRPGGRLLIESLHRDWVVRYHTPAPFAAVSRVGGDLMLDETTFDPMSGQMQSLRTVVRDGQVRTSSHSVRLPTPTELQDWLQSAGFRDVTVTGRNATPLTLDAPRLVALATA